MPSQISPPIEYFDGDPINAASFNGHVKNATLQNGSISEQVDIALSVEPVVGKTDNLVILDNSELTTNKLRKVKVEELFSSGAPIIADSVITSEINGKTDSQIDITPNAGVSVVGKNFVSLDGFNVTVTSTAHLLESGMLVEFTNAQDGGALISGHNGRYQITVLTSDTFTYRNGLTVATVAGSGTLDYRKAATVYIIGSEVVNDDHRVAGNSFVAGNSVISGSASVGSLTIGGKTPLTKEDGFISIQTKTYNMASTGGAWNTVDYATQSFNVPPGETWTFVWHAVTHFKGDGAGNTRADFAHTWYIRPNSTTTTGPILDQTLAGSQPHGGTSTTIRTLIVRNEGTEGNTHTIVSPIATTVFPGTMNLNWMANPPGRAHKWNSGIANMTITLYRQKTNTMPGQSGSGIPNVL